MKILYQVLDVNTIYAGRTIYNGYKNAFEDLGHSFKLIGLDDNIEKQLDEYRPDIFFTFLNSLSFKFHDRKSIKKFKKRGVRVFVNISFWNSPFSTLRFNESRSLSKSPEILKLIKSGDFGDIYFNVCEQGDQRMNGFEKATGYKYHTIPLAADKTINFPDYSEAFKADISYIGTNLPGKRKSIREKVVPLKMDYGLKIYGQDWRLIDRVGGVVNKAGCYFNIPILKSLQRPKLCLEDERKIYSSSLISINIHEDFQIKYGGECNERTFKIPLCGGFEICDNVSCLKKYFKEGKELIIVNNKKDWFEKVRYFMKNPEKRVPIIEAGRKKVMEEHTYHNRVEQFIRLYGRN